MLANISPDAKVSLHVLIGSWQLLLVVLLVANRIIFEQIRAKSMNGLSSRVLVNISPGAGYDSIKPAPLDRSPVRYRATARSLARATINHQSRLLVKLNLHSEGSDNGEDGEDKTKQIWRCPKFV